MEESSFGKYLGHGRSQTWVTPPSQKAPLIHYYYTVLRIDALFYRSLY